MMMTTTMMINDDHVDGDDHDVDAAFLHPFPPPPEPTQSKMEVGNIKAGMFLGDGKRHNTIKKGGKRE